LLEKGVKVNLRGSKNETPLHIAARYDHVRIALYLLRHGARKDAKDMDGWTPLHVATYYDNYGVMSILLEAGADVFALDCDLNYPINHIMDDSPLVPTMVRRMTEVKKSRKNFDLEKSRLEHNQKLNQMVLQMMKRADDAKCYISGLKDFRNQETGATLAHCLATYGLHLALETVIENDKEVVHLADNSGFTLLHCAAKFGQVECIKILIRHGADIKAVDKYLRKASFYAVDKQSQILLSGTGSLQEFDETDGSSHKKKKKSSKKEPKRVSSRRRFQKSMTARKRPDRVKTMCTKVLISNMTKFELEAVHAKRRLVQDFVAKNSPVTHITPPQLPPRGLSQSNQNSVTSLTSKSSGTVKADVIAENPYEVIKDSIESIPKAMSEIELNSAVRTPTLEENPQDNLVESVDSLIDLPPPPIPPKTQNLPKSDSSETSSSGGDYSIPDRSSLINPNVFLDTDKTSTPQKSVDPEVKTEMSEAEMHELITSAFPPPKPPKKSQTSVSSTEAESNEVQKYTPERFQSLLNKFEQPTSPVMNGSITRRNVQIKLQPGNLDYDVKETMVTSQSSRGSSDRSNSSYASSSSQPDQFDLSEFDEMKPIEEEDDNIWENLDAQLAETLNAIKGFGH